MKHRLLLLLRILATGGIFFILYKIVPYRDLLALLGRIEPLYVLAGFLFIFIGNILGALRWHYLLSELGIAISRREAVYAFFSSSFFNMFFPSFIAGDAFRSLALISRRKKPQKIIFSVLMDRASGFIALSGLTLAAFIAGKKIMVLPQIAAGVGIMVLAGAGMMAAVFTPGFLRGLEKLFSRWPAGREKIESFHGEFPLLRKKPGIFFSLVVYYSLPIQVMTCLSFYVLARGFALDLNAAVFFVLVPLSMMIAFLPLTIAGIGTRELALVYLFSRVGVAKSLSLGLGLLNLFFMIMICLIGGVIYVSVYHRWMERSSQAEKN